MRALIRLMLVAGLAAAGAAAAQTAPPGALQAAPVEVDLWSFKFDPDTVSLKAGQPYVLRLVNRSDMGHNFEAKSFFAAAQVPSADGVSDGRIELAPNSTREVHVVAPAAGTYEVHCTHFGHAALGMKGHIVVQ